MESPGRIRTGNDESVTLFTLAVLAGRRPPMGSGDARDPQTASVRGAIDKLGVATGDSLTASCVTRGERPEVMDRLGVDTRQDGTARYGACLVLHPRAGLHPQEGMASLSI